MSVYRSCCLAAGNGNGGALLSDVLCVLLCMALHGAYADDIVHHRSSRTLHPHPHPNILRYLRCSLLFALACQWH